MANNRMYLKHISSGRSILLCKYYPSTKWYIFHKEAELNAFLESTTDHALMNRNADALFGPTDFILEFEHEEGGEGTKQ